MFALMFWSGTENDTQSEKKSIQFRHNCSALQNSMPRHPLDPKNTTTTRAVSEIWKTRPFFEAFNVWIFWTDCPWPSKEIIFFFKVILLKCEEVWQDGPMRAELLNDQKFNTMVKCWIDQKLHKPKRLGSAFLKGRSLPISAWSAASFSLLSSAFHGPTSPQTTKNGLLYANMMLWWHLVPAKLTPRAILDWFGG